MYTKKLEKLVDLLIESKKCDINDKDIVVYGLSFAIDLGLNFITTIIFGILFNLVIESLIFLASFSSLRTYAGGYHCEKAINCYIMSSGIIVFVLTAIKLIPQEYIFITSVIMLIISAPIILKLAPVAASNKPLDVIEKVKYREKTFIIYFVECVFACILFKLGLCTYALVICIGLFLIGVSLVIK